MTRSADNQAASTKARRFFSENDGAIGVEFSIITPIMAVILLASAEATAAIWAKTAAEEATTVAADLTSQGVVINEAAISDIFDVSELMIDSSGAAVLGLEMRVTSVLTCPCAGNSDNFCYEVIWSHGYKDGELINGRPQGSQISNISQDLGITPNSTLIFAESEFDYDPIISFIFDAGALNFESRNYFRPRQSREIVHTGGFAQTQASTCS
ncbi:MAG: TadE/TadG family type IV pilus assembly protein [Pseudomonadota bacterium]